MAESFSNRLCVSNTFNDQKGNLHITGTFCGSLNFPRDNGRPFTLVERTTKNNKTYKQVKCSLVIVPDNRKTEKGYPTNGIRVGNEYKTFSEVIAMVGAELFNEKLYVTVYMNRNTMGLYQLMSDPNLSYRDNIMVSGELSFFKGNEGKTHAVIGNVNLFARDHVFDDKTEQANANCQLADQTGGNNGSNAGNSAQGAPSSSYNAPASSNQSGFVEIDDDDGELPF